MNVINSVLEVYSGFMTFTFLLNEWLAAGLVENIVNSAQALAIAGAQRD